MKNSTPRRQLPKLQLLNFLAKFLTERKYLMKTLTSAGQKHLQIKSSNLYSETNTDGLKAVFYKHFSNELAPVLSDVYEGLTLWVLPPEKESYLSYIKNVIKDILKTIDPFHF